MLTATTKKRCAVCGKDVSQVKRTKDASGKYYCRECYSAQSAAPLPDITSPAATGGTTTSATTARGSRSESVLGRTEKMIIAAGAAAIIVVILAGSYFLYFRDRWEVTHRDELRSLAVKASEESRDKHFREAAAALSQLEALSKAGIVRDTTLAAAIAEAIAKKQSIMIEVEKIDREEESARKAAQAKQAAIEAEQHQLLDAKEAAETRAKVAQREKEADRALMKSDPVAHFKRFAAAYVMFGKDLSNLQDKDGDERWVWDEKATYAINVQRTESLVTPYLGTLSSRISYLNKPRNFSVRNSDFTITFAAQDGAWVFKSVSATYAFAGGQLDSSNIVEPWLKWISDGLPSVALKLIPLASGSATVESNRGNGLTRAPLDVQGAKPEARATLPTSPCAIFIKSGSLCLAISDDSNDPGHQAKTIVPKRRQGEQWSFHPTTDGFAQLVNRSSGLCLGIRENQRRVGEEAIQWRWLGEEGQQWKIEPLEDGCIRMVNRRSGLCLTAHEKTDAPLTQETYDGNPLQMWRITPAS